MRFVRRFFVISMAAVIIPASVALPGLVLAQAVPATSTAAQTSTAVSSNPNANVLATVQSYFADIPVMIAIATCESGPRQFAADGSPLLGGTGTMVGVFQIDETIHASIAASLGFNIDTLAGNLGYARYLYGADGTEPWISSFPCWNNLMAATAPVTTVTSPTGAPVLTLDLSLGEIDPQVLILQQLLNKAGYTLAASGPGSPGNETDKFGALTYAALKAFQCAQGIACSGEEATTGYGFLNATTRAALLAATSNANAATASNGSAAASSSATGASSTFPIVLASTTFANGSTTSVITTTAAIATTTTSAIAAGDAAETAELQSRIAALVVIVQQLEAEIAARI